VRLLLDAHVSGRRIGAALRAKGHEVRAVDEERALDGCEDEEILRLAAAERRILVTLDAADFPRLAREWLETGRSHCGCAVLVGIGHHEFGAILRAVEAAFEVRSNPEDWRDYLAFVSRLG
jgi:predicted nuclease of predicted toxin-antitoxin system